MHTPDLTEMLLAQTFSEEEAVGPKSVYRFRTHPQAPRSVTVSGPVYPLEEPENRAWALLFAPTLVVLPST